MTSGREVAEAFENGYKATAGNYFTDGKIYCLFGNRIAQKDENGTIEFSNCGYTTVTTSKALNFLSGLSYHTKNGQAYNHGVAIKSNQFHKVNDEAFLKEIEN